MTLNVLPVKTPWNQSILFEELLPKSSGEAILSLRGRSSSTETGLPHFSQRATGKDRKIERSELTVRRASVPGRRRGVLRVTRARRLRGQLRSPLPLPSSLGANVRSRRGGGHGAPVSPNPGVLRKFRPDSGLPDTPLRAQRAALRVGSGSSWGPSVV